MEVASITPKYLKRSSLTAHLPNGIYSGHGARRVIGTIRFQISHDRTFLFKLMPTEINAATAQTAPQIRMAWPRLPLIRVSARTNSGLRNWPMNTAAVNSPAPRPTNSGGSVESNPSMAVGR